MSHETPQDAVTPAQTTAPETTALPTPAAATPQPTPSAPPAPTVTYLDPPSGPNWGLVLAGVVVLLVAAGVVAEQVGGIHLVDLFVAGPAVLVLVGLLCALVGLVGIVRRRRR